MFASSLGSMASGSVDYLLTRSSLISAVCSWSRCSGIKAIHDGNTPLSVNPPASSSIALCCGSSSGSSDVSIQRVEGLSKTTVDIEPPVADEVLLVEEGAVGAEEAVLGEAIVAVVSADVEGLAVSVGVSVVTLNLSITDEGGLWWLCEDGVILTRHAGDVVG